MSRPLELKGQKFGKLTAIESVGAGHDRVIHWRFRCDCGEYITRGGAQVRYLTAKGSVTSCLPCAQRAAPTRELTCGHCERTFTSKEDHGLWPKFCSRQCFLAKCVRPQEKQCAHCDAWFTAGKTGTGQSEDGRRIYCSKKCAAAGLMVPRLAKVCPHCSRTFDVTPSTARQRPDESCCSQECARDFYKGERHPAYKDGINHVSDSDVKFILCPRPGRVGKYVGEHRIVASKAIGRLLEAHEHVLHISGEKDDNAPDNLFICASIAESKKRQTGTLPWPLKTNLATYGR